MLVLSSAKSLFRNTTSVKRFEFRSGLTFYCPNLGPNCLQMVSTDKKKSHLVMKYQSIIIQIYNLLSMDTHIIIYINVDQLKITEIKSFIVLNLLLTRRLLNNPENLILQIYIEANKTRKQQIWFY